MDRNEYMRLLQSIWDARWGSENRSPIRESLIMLADEFDAEDDISEELLVIQTATKGEDMRIAIHDALEKLSKKKPDSSTGFICTPDVAYNSTSSIILPMQTHIWQFDPPPDCPFYISDQNYFINTQRQCTISGRTYTKSTADYAVGMIVVVDVEGYGVSTGVLYMSPVSQSSILYSPFHTYWGQYGDEKEFTYNGVTWYASGLAGGMDGNQRNYSSGMMVYPGSGEVWYPSTGWTEEILSGILEDLGVENREVE